MGRPAQVLSSDIGNWSREFVGEMQRAAPPILTIDPMRLQTDLQNLCERLARVEERIVENDERITDFDDRLAEVEAIVGTGNDGCSHR